MVGVQSTRTPATTIHIQSPVWLGLVTNALWLIWLGKDCSFGYGLNFFYTRQEHDHSFTLTKCCDSLNITITCLIMLYSHNKWLL